MNVVRSLAVSIGSAATLLCATSAPAVTVELVVGEWSSFQFDQTGSNWRLLGLPDPVQFIVTTDAPAELHVVDTFESGDQFAVFDDGRPLGLTSEAGRGNTIQNTPLPEAFDVAFGDPNARWSRGMFELSPGRHVFSGIVVGAAGNVGTGGLRVMPIPFSDSSRVPEPSMWTLLIAAVGLAWHRLFGGSHGAG